MRRSLAVGSILLASCAGPTVLLTEQAPPTLASEPGGYEVAEVRRVVDGDTLEVEVMEITPGPGAGGTTAGHTYRVRLTGIDTPESVRPGTPIECFAKEAAAATAALLEGHRVTMVKDVEDTDRFDRLLRYVYLGEEMANARLVVNGYANVYTYPPNVRWSELFVQLQREAREGDRGLWSPESCGGQV